MARNLYGLPLRPCSTPGMAVTGFTRDGTCSHHDGDRGSHHVCVTEVAGTDKRASLCTITGQPDWCSTEAPCQDASGMCPREHWCVCEWAFERFVKEVGCDALSVDPHATNALVLEHYDPIRNKKAYDCLDKKMKERQF